MFDLGAIVAKVKADISDFKAGMQEAQQHAGGFQKALGGIVDVGAMVVKGLAVASAATAAFGALSLREYSQSEDAVTQLEAALRSTHNAAGLYIDDLLDQASALQKVTKFSDEQVESAQALLLTFTNIKGAEFQKATGTILDMATALKTDATSAAQQLGKALNDPINGLAGLQRIGIRFSDSQQAVIEKLVQTGQTAKAQDVILQELNKRFGGSAVAAGGTISGQLTRLKNIWSDFMENVGFRVANVLRPALDYLLKWVDSMGGVWGIFDKLNTAFNETISLLTTGFTQDESEGIFGLKPDAPFIVALQTLHQVGKATFEAIKAAIDFLKPSLDLLWANVKENLIPALSNLWHNFLEPLMPLIGTILVLAIYALINALTLAIGIISSIANVLGTFGKVVSDTAYDAVNIFSNLPKAISNALSGLWGAITKPFKDAFDWVKNQANSVKDTVAGALNPLQRHSPSLVDLLNRGVPEIPKIYGKAFDQLNGMASGLRPNLVAATAGAATVNTNIYGPINTNTQADRDAFFRRLTRNQELAAKGLATKPGSVG